MSTKSNASIEKKPLGKEIFLILVGAFLALIPATVGQYLTYRAQINQSVYLHKLDAFSEYSRSTNKFLQDLTELSAINNFFVFILASPKSESRNRQLEQNFRDMSEIESRVYADVGSVNSQILIVNSLFSETLPLVDSEPLRLTNAPNIKGTTAEQQLVIAKKVASMIPDKTEEYRTRFAKDSLKLSKGISSPPSFLSW